MHEANDCLISLEQAYHLDGKLPVDHLVDAEELVPSLHKYQIFYLIGNTNSLKCRLINPPPFDKALI